MQVLLRVAFRALIAMTVTQQVLMCPKFSLNTTLDPLGFAPFQRLKHTCRLTSHTCSLVPQRVIVFLPCHKGQSQCIGKLVRYEPQQNTTPIISNNIEPPIWPTAYTPLYQVTQCAGRLCSIRSSPTAGLSNNSQEPL